MSRAVIQCASSSGHPNQLFLVKDIVQCEAIARRWISFDPKKGGYNLFSLLAASTFSSIKRPLANGFLTGVKYTRIVSCNTVRSGQHPVDAFPFFSPSCILTTICYGGSIGKQQLSSECTL